MGMPSMPNSKVEVLHYAQTVEGERRACCRALDSEQCGAGRSSHDTLNCVDPSHEFLHSALLGLSKYSQGSDGVLYLE